MENIFYILMAALWLIYTVYESNKKKKQKMQKPIPAPEKSYEHQSPSPKIERRDIFEETLESFNENINNYENNIKDYIFENSQYESLETIVDETDPGNSFSNISISEQDFQKNIIKKNTKIDLRKAVIYSELLHPKYF